LCHRRNRSNVTWENQRGSRFLQERRRGQ